MTVSAKRNILRRVRSVLVYHDALDLNAYPRSKNLEDFLHIKQYCSATGAAVHDDPPGQNFHKQHSSNMASPVKVATIEEIAEEVRICRGCSLHHHRKTAVPGVGVQTARLLIVGGWLITTDSAERATADAFGNEEDQMLSRMLQAINVRKEEAFITNLIKCGISSDIQPKSESIDACISYLKRQISSILPDLICAMGIIATRALLASSQPLSQLRGHFHPYKIDDTRTVDVMPTYHPTFLLQNPEMKMATWNDLQLVEKRLKTRNDKK